MGFQVLKPDSSTVDVRSNYVLVKSKSDLPTPVAGVITLADNTVYELNGTINLGTDNIELGASCVIKGVDVSDDVLVYSGTGSMISGTDKSATIENITLSTTTGSVFNLTNTLKDKQLQIVNCVVSALNVGTINGYLDVFIRENLFRGCTNGVVVNDATHFIFETNAVDTWANSVGAKFVEMQSGTFEVISIENNIFHPESNETAIELNPLATYTNLVLANNNFVGPGTYINGVDIQDTNVTLIGNANVPDATDNVSVGSMLMQDNATKTTFTAANTWTKIVGTTVAGPNNLRWSMPTDNQLQYNGSSTQNKVCTVSLDASRSGGSGNVDYEFSVFQNGSQIANVKTFLEVNAQQKNISIIAPFVANPNDTIEIYAMAVGHTNDLLVVNMQVYIV